MTDFIKKSELENKWFHIDATNVVVGRLAAEISKILRGKNKATFTPNMDNGDFVVVTNVEKIKFTGSKYTDKKYYKHTGWPGGISNNFNIRVLKKPYRLIMGRKTTCCDRSHGVSYTIECFHAS